MNCSVMTAETAVASDLSSIRGVIGLGVVAGLIRSKRIGKSRKLRRSVRRGKKVVVAEAFETDKKLVMSVQQYLNTLGYEAGAVDGSFGKKTQSALRRFQVEKGLRPTGRLGVYDVGYLSALSKENIDKKISQSNALDNLQKRLLKLGFLHGGVRPSQSAQMLSAVSNFRNTVGLKSRNIVTHEDAILLGNHSDDLKDEIPTVLPVSMLGGVVRSKVQVNKSLATEEENKSSEPVGDPRKSPFPTRLFAGPNQYPPEKFRGYGVLAFKTGYRDFNAKRFGVFCDAYVGSFPLAAGRPEPTNRLFTTIWPVISSTIADQLNMAKADGEADVCEAAVRKYDAEGARNAISAAVQSGKFVDDGIGPYLLAWSPSKTYGKKDAFVLGLDLSQTKTSDQARAVMIDWRREIETNFKLQREGFSLESLRVIARRWLDQHGEGFVNGFPKLR